MHTTLALPPKQIQALEKAVARLKTTLGERLVSLVLYGSAIREGQLMPVKDLNLMIVVVHANPEVLQLIGNLMADLVTAVSRLLADPRELSIFEMSPRHSASRLDVEAAESDAFCSLDPQELHWQADCLVDKRRDETQRQLPQTFAAIGGRCKDLFAQYASSHWPKGHHRHFEDAWRFTRFLREKHIRERDHAECNRLDFAKRNRFCSLRFLPAYWVRGRQRRAIQFLWKSKGERRERTCYFAVP